MQDGKQSENYNAITEFVIGCHDEIVVITELHVMSKYSEVNK